MDKKIRIQIIYEGKFYEYQDGFSAYLFEYAVLYGLDKKYGEKTIGKYIELVKNCSHYDSNETPIEDFVKYVACYWDCVCDFENYAEVLDRFYEYRAEKQLAVSR